MVTNSCKKGSGCSVEIELPYGTTPIRISDNTPGQSQAAQPKPKTR